MTFKIFLQKLACQTYLFNVYEYTVSLFRQIGRGHQIPFTNGCEPPCGCWELNLEPLEEQSVLLTAEPSLPSPFCFVIEFLGVTALVVVELTL